MNTKHMIYIAIFVGSTLGAWLGSVLDHGNFFGLWGLTLGTLGSFLGVWAGYRLANS